MSAGRFHLNLSLMTPGHFRGAWRLPGHDPRAIVDIDHFRRLAQQAEAAKIHAVFLGDSPSSSDAISRAPEGGIDPIVLFANLFAHTSRIGAIATSSTTYNEPYNLARRYSGLDHVSGGRTAFNAVTTISPAAAGNFGHTGEPPKAERYARAEEFLEVVTALWDAWDDGAIVADAASGAYADTSRIHPINHRGEHFSVAGTLSLPESPQGRPLIVQAGGSPEGIRLGARFADIVFTVAQTRERARAFRRDLAAAALERGRTDGGPITSLGVVVLVAATEEEAARRGDELLTTLDIEAATAGVLGALGIRPGTLGPDDLVSLDNVGPAAGGSDGFRASTLALLAEGPLTPRELVFRSAGGSGHRLLVGTAEQVADDLESWFAAGVADGFTIMPADTVIDGPAFLEQVVPLLQQRGSFQREYRGSTLRENYGLPFPTRRHDLEVAG